MGQILEQERPGASIILDLPASPDYKAPSSDFFLSPYRVNTKRVFVGADSAEYNGGLLNRERSRFRRPLLVATVTNSLFVYNEQGNVYLNNPLEQRLSLHPLGDPTTENDVIYGTTEERLGDVPKLTSFNHEKLDFVDGVVFVPASWWMNGLHVTEINTSKTHRKPAIIDLNDAVRPRSFRRFALLMGHLLKSTGEPVYEGGNHSHVTLVGDNLQSALAAHVSVVKPESDLAYIQPEDIINVRKGVGWDKGISSKFFGQVRDENGQSLRDQIQDIVNENYPGVGVAVDNMGVHFFVEGLTPLEYGTEKFIVFWRRISHTIHHRLDRLAEQCWGKTVTAIVKELEEVDTDIESPEAIHKAQVIYEHELAKPVAFPAIPLSEIEKEVIGGMIDLDRVGLLVHPPGWVEGIQFSNRGALFGIAGGFVRKQGIGPAQDMGFEVIRDSRKIEDTTEIAKTMLGEVRDVLLQEG